VDAVTLIPHIVEQFLDNDRAFRKSELGLLLRKTDD